MRPAEKMQSAAPNPVRTMPQASARSSSKGRLTEKSSGAFNLAASLAESGKSVLLIDADLVIRLPVAQFNFNHNSFSPLPFCSI